MRRVVLLVAVLALAGVAVWLVATGRVAPAGPAASPAPSAAAADPAAPAAPAGDHPAAPASATEWEVVSITDGDTLRLRDATGAVENVRLIGIDTPEVHPVLECFGDEAEAELARLAPRGSTLLGATDADPFDRYDRLLLYLWNEDGVFVNLALVEGGFAEAIRVAPNDAWYDELRAAEAAAERARLGMWSC